MALIEVHDLVKTYRVGGEDVRALDGVSLSIGQGEFVAVMGHSGSGKTTFMNVLGLLDAPSGGKYYLDGREVGSLSRDEQAGIRNRSIGFVFQGFNLLSRATALENVELPLIYGDTPYRDRKALAMEALRAVGLESRAAHSPVQLSGGQQQRVAIARALVNRTRIILADEPTGNLDSKTSEEIMGIFTRLNREQGITVVLVTHEADVATYAGRTCRFRDGKLMDGGEAGQ
jgi:putative ABC transport system ATP-binding protein